jgi:hypothetical protein
MRWYFARPPCELITADRPLLVNVGGSPPPLEIMSMAIDPRVLFVATPAWPAESEAEIDDLIRTMAAYHNLFLLRAKPRRVYSRDPLRDTSECRLRTLVEQELLTTSSEVR